MNPPPSPSNRPPALDAEAALRLLAEASKTLGSTLDYEATLESVARLSVPRFADGVAVSVLEADGTIRRLGIAHTDPEKEALALEIQRRYRPNPDAPAGVQQVLRSGRPEFYPDIPEAVVAGAAHNAEHLRLLRELNMTSYICVPMIARGRTLGALTFVMADSGRRYAASDLALAEDLAQRAALAVDNARLYREIREAETRYHALFEGAADGILITTLDGRYIDSNPAATALLGYTRADLEGIDLRDLVDSDAAWGQQARAAFQRGQEWKGELAFRRKDGATVLAETWTKLIDVPSGRVYVTALRDISARRALEQEKDQFLAAVSHDLKNPLTTIKGMTQMLQRRVARIDHPEAARVQEGLKAIDMTTTQMSALINELLDVSRVQMERPLDLDLAPTDLVTLARRVAEEYAPTSDRHTIRVEAAVPALVGRWDGPRLARVLGNLVANAIKYSPAGGEIVVSLAREEGADGALATLRVRDQGLGIPAVDLPRIFDRFYRAGNVGRLPGSGLGLTGVRQIVEQHGGSVTVASEEGKGTIFTLRLPLEERPGNGETGGERSGR